MWLQSQKRETARDVGTKLSKAVKEMFEIWTVLDTIQTRDEKPNMSFFATQMKFMTTEYSNMMSKSKALTGSVFEDQVVRNDFIICKNYMEILMERVPVDTLLQLHNKRLNQ